MDSALPDFVHILASLRGARVSLANRFKIDIVGVAGSLARGDYSDASDVDVAARLLGPTGLFEIVEVKEQLEHLLLRRVDLVFPEALPTYRKVSFERDLVLL